MNTRQNAQIEALYRRQSAGGDLSVPQQRTNDSIDAARKRLSGMSSAEVLAMTQASTATGRANDRYDPEMARLAKLANSRKYGDDPAHDDFTTARQRPAAQAQGNQTPVAAASASFAANPAMRGFQLGEQTARGFKVLDANGKHVGYFGNQ